MNFLELKEKIKNPNNKFIIDEFIRYYNWIYSNYTNLNKPNKEIYYKLQVIKKTIQTIAKFTKKIHSGTDLENIKGIGPKTISRIDEIIQTGKLSEISTNTNQTEIIKELSSIYGIGNIKALEFYNMGIQNLSQLIIADKTGVIKLTDQMKLGIKYKDRLNVKIPRLLITSLDIFVNQELNKLDTNFISVICGSYRRQKDFSSDIDILITHKKLTSKNDTGKYLKIILDNFGKYFIVDSLTTINPKSTQSHYQGFASFKSIPDLPKTYDKKSFNVQHDVIRLDIIITPIQHFYPALLHFTGSGDFNQKLRLHAKSLGYKLSEYGLTKLNGDKTNIDINSENDIFKLLLLKYVPPEKR